MTLNVAPQPENTPPLIYLFPGNTTDYFTERCDIFKRIPVSFNGMMSKAVNIRSTCPLLFGFNEALIRKRAIYWKEMAFS